MTDYDEYRAELRRPVILKLLSDFPNYRGNDDVLQQSLVDFGREASIEEVQGDLSHLESHGLVTLTRMKTPLGDFLVAELTRRGGDVAAGRLSIPGIRRPLPGRI